MKIVQNSPIPKENLVDEIASGLDYRYSGEPQQQRAASAAGKIVDLVDANHDGKVSYVEALALKNGSLDGEVLAISAQHGGKENGTFIASMVDLEVVTKGEDMFSGVSKSFASVAKVLLKPFEFVVGIGYFAVMLVANKLGLD